VNAPFRRLKALLPWRLDFNLVSEPHRFCGAARADRGGTAMATTADRTTPVHLWIVGIVSLLWNAFGCYDYLMTMTANEAWMAQFTAEQIAYWESLPAWNAATWALGVWGGLVGALMLLLRSRYAVWAYAVSAFGAVVGLGYQMFMTEMPASMTEGAMAIMPWVIIIVALFQLWYSWSMEKKGALR
jgi:hypothetical protein